MRSPEHRGTTRLVIGLVGTLCLLMVCLFVTGCACSDSEIEKEIADQDRKDAQTQAATSAPVMQYEESETDALTGDWSYTGMNYVPSAGRLYPDTELHTVTIIKQGEVHSLKGAADSYTVTFDGKNVTIKGGPAGGVQSELSGVLQGDTIVGTRHHSAGSAVYDGPWTATRVK